MRMLVALCYSLTALVAIGSPAGAAPDPCSGFRWDVAKEHTLFVGPGTALSAGRDVVSAPRIVPGRLYELTLVPEAQIKFALEPEKKHEVDEASAGLASLVLDVPGNYRVSADAGVWIDVVDHGRLAPTRDFQGIRGCDAPHKIVEFDLSGGRNFLLQINGSTRSRVKLAVTRVAPAPTTPPSARP